MSIARHGLETQLAKRVVALFVLCALLPVGVALAVVYRHVQQALIEAHDARLGQAVEGYGTTVLERLYLAEQLARALGDRLDAEGELARHVDAAAVYRRGAPPRAIVGRAADVPALAALELQPEYLRRGHTQVTVVAAPGGPQVWLVRQLPDANGVEAFLALRPAYAALWGDPDELPFGTHFCVLDHARRPLHCSAPLPEAALATLSMRLAAGPAGRFEFAEAGGTQFASFREIFVQSRFRAGSWPVVAWQADTFALAPIVALRAMLVPLIAITLLAAALLGLTQVRRTLQPLQQLVRAVGRIGARDFAARVPVNGTSEFRDLAVAFNGMSERLGRQFGALQTFAEVDAVILAQVDMDRIAALVVTRMQEVVRGRAWLLLLAEGAGPRYRVRASRRADGERVPEEVTLSAADVATLAAAPHGLRMGRGTGRSILPPLLGADARQVLAVPILVKGSLNGILVVGGMPEDHHDPDEAVLLQGFADRIAVGQTAAMRERELFRRANFDPLTELPNRRSLLEALERDLARDAAPTSEAALLFIDLDGFSKVNDTLGHSAGDRLLLHAATRLRGTLREGDLVARLGGDEFVLVLVEPGDAAQVSAVAQRVRMLLSEPYDVGHGDTYVGASIGIAMYPRDGLSPSVLLQRADLAMYQAKQRGTGHACFEDEMLRAAERRFRLGGELRRALDRGELCLHYQPQLELASGRVTGAEALIRWQHPERGLVPPGEFIGFAEESGLIEEMGAWAVAEACRQLVAWRGAGIVIDHVSVNVSPRQFRGSDFVTTVAQALAAAGLAPASLRLEITESVLADDAAAAEQTLARLHALGTPLELDDFGTGYSSLAYLQRLPVETVKLDRSFIRDIATGGKARALAKAAIEMVHALDKQVLAEGVETREQATQLRAWRCEAIQGYLISRPVAAAQFPAAIEAAQRVAAVADERNAA